MSVLSAVSAGGYTFTVENVNAATEVTFNEANPIKPCVEIVSAGNNNDGAVILSQDLAKVEVVGVEVDGNGNLTPLEGSDSPIAVTIRSTGM